MSPSDTVILAATRTPLGSFQGALAAVPVSRLASAAIFTRLMPISV